MRDLLLALHLLFAIFAIGPLVHAATTAGRGVRTGDAAATAGSARVLRIYSYASVLVIVAGFGLMSQKGYGGEKHLGEFTDPWIWISLLLWAVAIAIVLALIVPTLSRVTAAIGRQESVVSQTGKVAAAGGVVAIIFVVIVFLMTYQPGG